MFEVGQPNTLSTADNYKRRFSLVSTFTYRGGFKGTLTVEEDLEDGGSSTKTEVIPVRCHPMRYATTEGEKVE